MKQQCHMASRSVSWVIVGGGLIFFLRTGADGAALLLPVIALLFPWTYVRFFPAVSRYMGYGRVDDQPAQAVGQVPAKVTLYTALGCPFCPLVKQRLLALQAQMGFELEEVDVTLKPNLLIVKGIRSVPVRWESNEWLDAPPASNWRS